MSSRTQHRQWSVALFERDRAHLCDWLKITVVQAIEQGKRRILIRAPVKSGKRQMVEYLAMRDNATNPTRQHKFLTAWHRKADEDQRAELKCYGIEVFSGITGKKKEDYNAKIRATLQSDPRVTLIIHIDECDHGSAERQVLAEIWREWRDNANVIFILYSATPEEVIYSGEIDSENEEMMGDLIEGEDECESARFDYTPPETFCGPAKFLDAGLVYEARPFFEKALELGAQHRYRLTTQGRQVMDDLRKQIQLDIERQRLDRTWKVRNILMLRISYDTDDENDTTSSKPKSKQDKKAIHQFLKNLHMFPEEELGDCQIYVDKDEAPPGMSDLCVDQKIQWSNPKYWDGITESRPVIIINDQTCSRSTELAAHDRIFAYHDYRRTITFSVCSQASERPNHYSTKYSGVFQRIRIYCHEKTMLLSAGRISHDEYIEPPQWMMKKQYNAETYQIVKNDRTRRLHPDHPNPMTEADAKAVLLDLKCDKIYTKLSARVRGKIDDEIIIHSVFVPCSSAEEFDRLRSQGLLDGKNGRGPRDNLFEKYSPNPENPDKRFECSIRSTRKVRTVEEVEFEHWGINEKHTTRRHICYNQDGVCGVLLQTFNGYREVDTLTCHKSMYRPKQKSSSSPASAPASSSDDTDTDTD
jgi:hypothetical protein